MPRHVPTKIDEAEFEYLRHLSFPQGQFIFNLKERDYIYPLFTCVPVEGLRVFLFVVDCPESSGHALRYSVWWGENSDEPLADQFTHAHKNMGADSLMQVVCVIHEQVKRAQQKTARNSRRRGYFRG